MRAAWSKGTAAELRAAKFIEGIIDLDTSASMDGRAVYLVDEEAGYVELYKKNAQGRHYVVLEEGMEMAAWERIHGRFKIVWKANAPPDLAPD